MLKSLIAIGAAVAALLIIAPGAHADTTCKSGRVDGVRVSLTVWGSTSCGLAKNTARAVVNRGYAPKTLRVKSPATGKRYTLRRSVLETDADYWSVVYTGSRNINVQIQLWL